MPISCAVPERHLLQAADPGSALNVPGSHGEHTPPSRPVKPALQVQADDAALPAGELESAGIREDQIHRNRFINVTGGYNPENNSCSVLT